MFVSTFQKISAQLEKEWDFPLIAVNLRDPVQAFLNPKYGPGKVRFVLETILETIPSEYLFAIMFEDPECRYER